MQAQLIRFNFWLDPIFDEILEADSGIHLTQCHFEDPEARSWDVMAKAHAYQISAARDEVPLQWQVTHTLLERAPELLCVSSSGAGFDTVDVAACTEHGVIVVNQSGCNANSVAEHTFGLLLSLTHRLNESDRVMRAGRCGAREDLMGHEIRGLTLGIVGVGNVGTRVAQIAPVFGMRVLGCDPHIDAQQLTDRGVEPVNLETLIQQSDVVSLHCPRNSETLNLFDAKQFAKMKPGAIFMSTARGGIHDETALAAALASGHLAGAGLDVWSLEPPVASNPLLSMNNVVATYHTAGVTHEARHHAARMGAQQLCELFATANLPPRLVNPQAWPAFTERYRKRFR